MTTRYTPSILILYSSRFGQCQKIAETMAAQLEVLGNQCEVANIEEPLTLNQPLAEYDSIAITASIRYGFYHKKIRQFVPEHLDVLKNTLDAFIPVNLIARNPERRTIERNGYVRKFLEKTGWEPKLLSIMPGALTYPRYNALDRFMIRMIMSKTGGETDPTKTVNYTDWEEVKAFARLIDKTLRNKRLEILYPKLTAPQLTHEADQTAPTVTHEQPETVEAA